MGIIIVIYLVVEPHVVLYQFVFSMNSLKSSVWNSYVFQPRMEDWSFCGLPSLPFLNGTGGSEYVRLVDLRNKI